MESRQGAQARGVHLTKACFSCIRAKRRCDKSIPSCGRCMDKGLPCKFPLARPYARRKTPRPASEQPAEKLVGLENTDEVYASTSGLNWDDDEYLLSLWMHPDDSQDNDRGIVAPPPLANSDWFLLGDSWSAHEYDLADFQPKIGLSHWKGYIKCVRRWLYQWVTDARSPFIHRYLYAENGLPSCLQDAYSTLAAYVGKTENNEEVVMQLVADKTNFLLQQRGSSDLFSSTDSWGISSSPPAADILEHLAQVQALFIYQFIRLFDGDIKHRAQAEQHNATLQQWRTQLWEAARLRAYLQQTLGEASFSNVRSHDVCGPAAQVWDNWILAESIRRTWIVVNYTYSVYITLRDGQGSCPGSIAYTLRRGLWDAATPTEWCRLAHNQDPLFMRSDPPDMLFAKASPPEVDEFGLSIVSIMWDSRRIDAWFARAPDTSLQALLHNSI
ncbi:hypothetical protein EV127DRAFT_88910 [Xylaria flabelliformis]|nr:hypothetical protein EV127DRAFT_88910 [Xylaria flabelliformis]